MRGGDRAVEKLPQPLHTAIQLHARKHSTNSGGDSNSLSTAFRNQHLRRSH